MELKLRRKPFSQVFTFSRPTLANYIGADGTVKTAGFNEPRFEYDETTLVRLGLKFGDGDTASAPLTTEWFNEDAGTLIVRSEAPNGITSFSCGTFEGVGVDTPKTYVYRYDDINDNILANLINFHPNSDVVAGNCYFKVAKYFAEYIDAEEIDAMIELNDWVNDEWYGPTS